MDILGHLALPLVLHDNTFNFFFVKLTFTSKYFLRKEQHEFPIWVTRRILYQRMFNFPSVTSYIIINTEDSAGLARPC